MQITLDTHDQICALLKSAGISFDTLNVTRCVTGGNNQTFSIQIEDQRYIVKKYFSNLGETRNRLMSECHFLAYAQKVVPGMVPCCYGYLETENIGLYEFIEGASFDKGSISENEIVEAVKFFCQLNQSHYKEQAHQLGNAAEACFSMADHFKLIKTRIEQLKQVVPATPEGQKVIEYAMLLDQHWERLFKESTRLLKQDGLQMESMLDVEQRCISPSDFGFHNALRKVDHRICFLDFEYAGWDDPAKMVADFFAQLAIPIPERFYEQFTAATMKCFLRPEELIKRSGLLRPLYQIKWCCIALNIFLPYHLERKKFAIHHFNEVETKRTQLAKAKAIMQLLGLQEN